jgi:hypothetical protein
MEMLNKVESALIAKQKGQCGFAVMGGELQDGTPYAYTLGLARRGLPELMVIGPNVVSCGAIVHAAGHRMIDNGPPADGEVFDMQGNNFAIKTSAQPDMVRELASVAFHDNPALQPEQFVQLVIADLAGLMPWQEGFDHVVAHHQDMLWREGAPTGVTLH